MRTTDIFKTKAKTLKESFEKTFGQKLKLETFSVTQLEDARNRLRTQIHQVRNGGNFNETVENEAFTKAQWMLDSINAELAERFEDAAIHPAEVSEGDDAGVELRRIVSAGDFDGLYELMTSDSPAGKVVQDMYQDISSEHALHPDDDFEDILNIVMDRLEDEYGTGGDSEGGETDDAYALASAGHGSDEDYGDFGGYDESQTQGNDMTRIRESAADKAGAVVVAKDMTDKVGRWIEELSGMENDQLISLGDTIRDEMGQDAAKAYLEAVAPAIQQALQNLKQTREILASGMRQLTGEEQSAEIIGSEPAEGGEEDMAAVEPDALNPEAGIEGEEDFFAEPAGDEFAAAEPAAGGLEQAGREKRESIERQNSLLKILAG